MFPRTNPWPACANPGPYQYESFLHRSVRPKNIKPRRVFQNTKLARAPCHSVMRSKRRQNIKATSKPTHDKPAQPYRPHLTTMTLSAELNQEAQAILSDLLGPVDFIRFLRLLESWLRRLHRHPPNSTGRRNHSRTLHQDPCLLATLRLDLSHCSLIPAHSALLPLPNNF